MKKVLVITYYWPPGGGAGVQRWVKFVKYLNCFGWEPVVYTPENAEYPETDTSYLSDLPDNLRVLKTPIKEPYDFYKAFIGQKKNVRINTGFLSESKKKKFSEKLSVWIRGNFFIPDAKMFWIRPSVKFLKRYLLENPVDAIVSTGPPHSLHLIARKVSLATGIPWLADFRDPWTRIDFYTDLMLTPWADSMHHRLERKVIRDASAVTVISESMKREFQEVCQRPIEVITNGYDSEDMLSCASIEPDEEFSIAHVGTIARSRNPVVLWEALKELILEDTHFAAALKIKIVGKADISVKEAIEANGLTSFVHYTGHVNHAEAIKMQQESRVLLLSINNTQNAGGILTSKFFEYMAARRPILCIGPTDGDAAKVLAETQSGLCAGYNDKELLKSHITEFYRQYKNNTLQVNSSGIEKYSRLELTSRMAALLDTLIK